MKAALGMESQQAGSSSKQQQQQQSQGLEEPVGSSGRQQQASTRKSRKSHLEGQSGRGCRFAISAGSRVGPCQRPLAPLKALWSPLEPSQAAGCGEARGCDWLRPRRACCALAVPSRRAPPGPDHVFNSGVDLRGASLNPIQSHAPSNPVAGSPIRGPGRRPAAGHSAPCPPALQVPMLCYCSQQHASAAYKGIGLLQACCRLAAGCCTPGPRW